MSKFSNEPMNLDGKSFASKLEGQRYADLVLLQRAGKISNLQTQVTYRLEAYDQLICKYIADFVYTDENGRLVVEDTKGCITPEFRIKAKLFRAQYGFDIQLVFAKGPRLNMGEKKSQRGR